MIIEPKKHLININRIGEDFIDRKKFIRLDKNERTVDFDEKIMEELKQKIDSYLLSAYPEPEPLYDNLSKYLNIENDELFITAGSDLAIKTVFEVFISENDEVLIHQPSYAMSSIYCSLFNAKKVSIPFSDNLKLNLNKFCEKITNQTRLVIFENPNGFVGRGFSLDQIIKIIKKAKDEDALILIDEAYYPFHDQTAINLINNFDNLIISRTFSKSMALAGVRIGYLISNKKMINNLSKFRPMHEISSLASVIGCFFVDHIHLLDNFINDVKKEMSLTVCKLQDLGFEAHETDANFILVKIPQTKSDENFQDLMRMNGFLVRRPFNEGFLNGLVRIGIGSHDQMDSLIKIIKNNF